MRLVRVIKTSAERVGRQPTGGALALLVGWRTPAIERFDEEPSL